MTRDVVSDELPSDRRRLGAAILLILGVSLSCYLLDLWVIGRAAELSKQDPHSEWLQHLGVLRSVLENLIAGALAALILALSYRSIIRWIDPGDRVVEISSTQITDRLLKNARKTRQYLFIGNTATFVTSAVLPVLIDTARTTSQARAVTLFLIDPVDQPTVLSYNSYSDGLGHLSSKVADATLAIWLLPSTTPKRHEPAEVVGKVLASIYLAAYAVVTHGLTGSVYLRRTFTPFRLDLSDQEAVLTQESPSEAAVAFSSRGHFYGWYQKESEALRAQCVHIDLTSMRDRLRNVIAHPASPKQDIHVALCELLRVVPHLQKLSNDPDSIAAAVKRICHPSHTYRK